MASYLEVDVEVEVVHVKPVTPRSYPPPPTGDVEGLTLALTPALTLTLALALALTLTLTLTRRCGRTPRYRRASAGTGTIPTGEACLRPANPNPNPNPPSRDLHPSPHPNPNLLARRA